MVHLFVLVIFSAALVAAEDTWLVGAATRIITPTVEGSTDYVIPIDENDGNSIGTFVPAFDDGIINIGNGARDAHWVHDHIRTTAFVMQASMEDTTLVVVHSDTYMMFRPDIEAYKAIVKEQVGDEVYDTLRFLVAATHNHEGPDTSGLSGKVNRGWYSHLLHQMASATVEALTTRRVCRLTVAESEWRFGLGDKRDPRTVDPTLNVLQAISKEDGAVVGTLVQWAFHPEVTLGFSPDVPTEDCLSLGEDENCSGKGRYISGDFPGYLAEYLGEMTGGAPVTYISGAVGVQIGNHGPVWEVSEEYPIEGDGSTVPDGAEPVSKSFRKMLLIGRELAYQVARSLSPDAPGRTAELPPARISYTEGTYLTPMRNVLFRAGLAPDLFDPSIPAVLGYELRELYVCEPGRKPTKDACKPDNYEVFKAGDYPLPLRIGDVSESTIAVARFGPVTIFTIPGEIAPELSHGLPADFDDEGNVDAYYQDPEYHALQEDYELPGVLKDMLDCDYCFTFGLTNDAGGYIFPIADWRLPCSVRCSHDGYITGEACRFYAASPLEMPSACKFGQISQVSKHYEETVAVGWDAADDLIFGYADLLGVPPSGRYTKDDWTK